MVHFSRYTRAFTLVEIITVVALLGIIMIAVSTFQYNVLTYNRASEVSLTNAEEAQSLIKVMAKELRSMEASSNGAYPISVAATSTITFFADVDGDGTKEQIRYYIGTTTVRRGVIKPTGSPLAYTGGESLRTLATGIRNASSSPLFEYFDNTYEGTSSPMTYPLTVTSIRLIRVSLTIDTDLSKIPVLKTFTTQVGLRNLKDNL